MYIYILYIYIYIVHTCIKNLDSSYPFIILIPKTNTFKTHDSICWIIIWKIRKLLFYLHPYTFKTPFPPSPPCLSSPSPFPPFLHYKFLHIFLMQKTDHQNKPTTNPFPPLLSSLSPPPWYPLVTQNEPVPVGFYVLTRSPVPRHVSVIAIARCH